ncbi:hypothetical protein D3C85_721290 [compost metagenome]
MPVRLEKLTHTKQVRPGKASQSRLGTSEMSGQLSHHPITPLRRFNLAADVGPNLPVQLYQLGVDGLHGAMSRGHNQLGNFTESRIERGIARKIIHVRAFPFQREGPLNYS